ncbi:hypothetical protein JT27_15820 [Alcaligenes faecalis]|nr:hypothetical protein JT27_15820 [Alcaligenes faecalis]
MSSIELGQIRGLWSSVQGLDKYARTLFHQGDKKINAYTYGITELNNHSEVRHTPTYQFKRYEDYRDFLTGTLSDIHATAETQKYAAYLSSGYDSVACASLMKHLGGGLTMSVTKGRQGRDDSGAPIAEALGLPNITITAKDRHTITDERGHMHTVFGPHDVFDIGEFGLGTGLQDAPLKVDSSHVRSKVVLTGFHGDKVWDKHAEPSDDIKRGDSSGTGFYEYRLRTGFVHVVVPMLGALQHRQINAISNSPEMTPWSVGNQYDRPISRRMAEELGVPRHLFGQKKNAVAAQAVEYDSVKELYFAFIRNRYLEALYS